MARVCLCAAVKHYFRVLRTVHNFLTVASIWGRNGLHWVTNISQMDSVNFAWHTYLRLFARGGGLLICLSVHTVLFSAAFGRLFPVTWFTNISPCCIVNASRQPPCFKAALYPVRLTWVMKNLWIANETSLFLFIIENPKREVFRQLIGDTVNSAMLACYILLVQAEVHVFAVHCICYKLTVCPGFSRTVSEIRCVRN